MTVHRKGVTKPLCRRVRQMFPKGGSSETLKLDRLFVKMTTISLLKGDDILLFSERRTLRSKTVRIKKKR